MYIVYGKTSAYRKLENFWRVEILQKDHHRPKMAFVLSTQVKLAQIGHTCSLQSANKTTIDKIYPYVVELRDHVCALQPDDFASIAAAKLAVQKQIEERTSFMRDVNAAFHSPVYLMAMFLSPCLTAGLSDAEERLAARANMARIEFYMEKELVKEC